MDENHNIIDYQVALPDHLAKMQRLQVVIDDPMTMEIVIQRVIDGESLKAIARAWQLPPTRFVKWISDDEARLDQYEGALRVRADGLVHEALDIADEQKFAVNKAGVPYDPDVARDKLRIETRFKAAAAWDKNKYGGEKATGGAGINIIINRGGAEIPENNTVTVDG